MRLRKPVGLQKKMAEFGDLQFVGLWKVVKVEASGEDASEHQGCVFQMTDSGDLLWSVPTGQDTPYLAANFDLYEVSGKKFQSIEWIGSVTGYRLEFSVRLHKKTNLLILTFEGDFKLYCERMLGNEDDFNDEPLSLLPALREGFFTDVNIVASNGKKFPAHLVILEAVCPQQNWRKTPGPICGLSEEVIRVILHYVYTECLPAGLEVEATKACQAAISKIEGFERFISHCEILLQNMAVKNDIISHINEIYECSQRIISIFEGQEVSAERETGSSSNPLSDPSKFCYVFKQAIREAMLGGVHYLLVCDLFCRRQSELSKEERQVIFTYTRSRLPDFIKQLQKFVQVLQAQFYHKLTPMQRQEIALYLVPEIDNVLQHVTKFVTDIQRALDGICKASAQQMPRQKKGDFLSRSVKKAIHVKELMKMKSVRDWLAEYFHSLKMKKQQFDRLQQDGKNHTIIQKMEQVIDKFPLALYRTERLAKKVSNDINLKTWKFMFKMAASKVSWALQRAAMNKQGLKPVLDHMCQLVDRKAFKAGLVSLGLLEDVTREVTGIEASTSEATALNSHVRSPLRSIEQSRMLDALCRSPKSSKSHLAKCMAKLLDNHTDTDMHFEVVCIKEEPSDVVVEHSKGRSLERHSTELEEHRQLIPAHRVVIASRCDWFRRALLSGMKESIDRKISVHDADADLFKQFLAYLYTGQLQTNTLSINQLADMLSLCDRFEVDDLKTTCEYVLRERIDDDSVLFLLSLADQLHAKHLREASLRYIMIHPSILESDVFEDLPDHLQDEVNSLVTWRTDSPVNKWRHLAAGFDSDSDDSTGFTNTILPLKYNERTFNRPGSDSTSESEEEEHRAELESCIAQLRDIIGTDIAHKDLVVLAIAADYDVNRAVNHYFAQNS